MSQILKGARQKNVDTLASNPSPVLLLMNALLDGVELRSVSIETDRGLDLDRADDIVKHYQSKGWTILHTVPRPDGFSIVVAPTRDITPDHRERLAQTIQYDRHAPLKKLLKREAFLTSGEHSFWIDTETVSDDGWAIMLPYGPFRVRYESSANNSNDGHAAIMRSAAEQLIATSLLRNKTAKRSATSLAKRYLKGATHIQCFFVGAHGASKGIHVIRGDKDFEHEFGPDVQAISDSENLKTEMWLKPGHFTAKINVWRPRGQRSAVLTASEDLRRRINTDVLGSEQTNNLQTAAIQRLLAETRSRITNGEPFTQEDAIMSSWSQDIYADQRLYQSQEERAVAASFGWTGSIHPKMYGGVGAFTSNPGSRIPIQGITCILGGNARYYGDPEPDPGYLGFAYDDSGRPHSATFNHEDYPNISFTLDTADHDGDLAVVVPATDPDGLLSEDTEARWAMVLRTPASPGGVAWLRLREPDWNAICNAGAMPITVNGSVPYKEYMLPDENGRMPVHTLRPLGDMRAAAAWDTDPDLQIRESIHNRNQAALIGVFYRVMTAGHNADVLDVPTPQWIEELYQEHNMPPSTTGGSSTCFSEYVDSVGKLLTPPIDAMAEVICTAVTERGLKMDRCIKDSLWQPMFDAFSRTTSWDNRQIAQTLNKAFTENCMGDHLRSKRNIAKSTAWFQREFTKLQLMSNGPATLMLAPPNQFPGDLVTAISETHQRITRQWAGKFAQDRDIDALVAPPEPVDSDLNRDDDQEDDGPQAEPWERISARQAEQQKALAYRRTSTIVARITADALIEAVNAGHTPSQFVGAWIRLTVLSTNRFGQSKNGYRQDPQPANTTTLFKALSILAREQPEIASQATDGFAADWPGTGPTVLVKLTNPDAIIPGERAEIRLNPTTGEYLLCRNGNEPLTKVTAGGPHFPNLPLTYAGSPTPLDPTGDSGEQGDLHLFMVASVFPQTVIVPTQASTDEFDNEEEVTITRDPTPDGPAYYLQTARKPLEQSLKAGRQPRFNRVPLEGIHELNLDRTFRFAGTTTKGHALLRQEYKRTSQGDKLVESILEMVMPASA